MGGRSQKLLVNAFFVVLGFFVSGGLKHFFGETNSSGSTRSGGELIFESKTVSKPFQPHDDSNDESSSPTVEGEVVEERGTTAAEIKEGEETGVKATAATKITTTIKNHRPDSKVQFVYYIGLEGAGHDYLHNITQNSPIVKELTDLGVYPDDVKQIQDALLHERTGLWSAYFFEKSGEELQLTQTRANLVENLKRVNDKLTSKGEKDHYYIPINILFEPHGDYGRVRSLQQGEKKHRMIQYPSVDIFYDACDDAGVDCRQIYVWRNPYEVLHKSTAPHILEAMHTSISMLLVIASQMRMHSDRTLGCWNLCSSEISDDAIKGFGTVFGWNDDDNKEEWKTVMKDNHVPLQLDDGKHISDIVPSKNQNYFDSMMKSHNTVLDICNENQVFG